MKTFEVGDVVQITGPIMKGSVGTVVSKDEERSTYLVRITDETQNYYPADELVTFRP